VTRPYSTILTAHNVIRIKEQRTFGEKLAMKWWIPPLNMARNYILPLSSSNVISLVLY
jgi:hypothetical protein